jgi:hypothetical protein
MSTPSSQSIDPSSVSDPLELVQLGIAAAREEQWERGLLYLSEAYRRLQTQKDAKVPPAALSFYGLCLAVGKGRVKEAAEFCALAIEKEFYNGDHYANMARVWVAGRARRKAIEAVEKGLTVDPAHKGLHQLRSSLGVRKRPVLPFLHRDNPLNVSLGRVRHTMRVKRAEAAKAKAKKKET